MSPREMNDLVSRFQLLARKIVPDRLDCGDRALCGRVLQDIINRLEYIAEVHDAGCSVLVDNLREDEAASKRSVDYLCKRFGDPNKPPTERESNTTEKRYRRKGDRLA